MRIRTIKPEFWSHPVLTRMTDDARLCAVGLLSVSDDEGYFLASPALIRSQLWPLDEDSTKARRTLAQCVSAGWCQIKTHPTHGDIGFVVNFTKHQRVDRPNPSKLRTYFLDDDSSNARRTIDDQSLQDQGSGNRDQGSGNGTGNGTGNGGGVGEKTKGSAEASPASKLSDEEWLRLLTVNPAYQGIDVLREFEKMKVWCDTNKKQPTRRRFTNWLNRSDRPIQRDPRTFIPGEQDPNSL